MMLSSRISEANALIADNHMPSLSGPPCRTQFAARFSLSAGMRLLFHAIPHITNPHLISFL